MSIIAAIQQIDPFVVSYMLGLLILLFFVRERLDVPRATLKGAAASGPGAPNFINRLPPSLIRVRRFFFLACLVYFIGLAIFYSLICMLFALGAKGLVPEEIGFDSALAADILPSAGLDTLPSTENAFYDALLQLVSRESAISQHPWNPLVVALGMVGILPSLPYIGRGEAVIRRWSLWVVGIPSSVLSLWRALRNVNVSELYEKWDTQDQPDWLEKTASAYGRITNGPEDHTADIEERLAKIRCYSETNWPSEEIKGLFRHNTPAGLDPDIDATLQEAEDLTDLSLAVEVAQRSLVDRRVSEERGGFADPARPIQGAPQQEADSVSVVEAAEAISSARSILANRWGVMAGKLRGNPEKGQYGQTDLCCLMVALYAERTPVAVKSEEAGHAQDVMQEWIRRARAGNSDGATSANLFLFASLFAITLAYVAIFVISQMQSLAISPEIPDGSSPALLAWSFAVKLAIMLFPTLVVVHLVRAALDKEGRWQPWTSVFEPRTLEYLGLAALAIGISTIVQVLYSFVDPFIGNYTNQTLQLSEVVTWKNLTRAFLTAIPGAIFALVVSLSFDQEARSPGGFRRAVTIIAIMLPFLLGGALLFDPDFASVQNLILTGQFLNADVFLWLLCVLVGYVVFTFIVASIWHSRRGRPERKK